MTQPAIPWDLRVCGPYVWLVIPGPELRFIADLIDASKAPVAA